MLEKNIVNLRKQRGLTQEQLAEKLGVSRQTIVKWEKGEATPDSYNLIELSKFFNVKVQDLILTEINFASLVTIPVVEKVLEQVEKVEVINESINESKKRNKRIIPVLIGLFGLVLILSVGFVFFNDEISKLLNGNEVIEDSGELVNNNDTEEIVDNPDSEVATGEESFTNAMVSAGRNFSVYMDDDGKLTGYGDNEYQQLNFSNWTDLKEISAGGFHTLGLRNDGTVLATGYNAYGQLNV